MPAAVVDDARWEARRKRADELRDAWPFAQEVLGFYSHVLVVQQRAFADACAGLPDPGRVPAYVAQRVVPRIIEASAQSGPAPLMRAMLERFHEADLESLVRAWLQGDELRPVERFVARAASGPVLEALGPAAGACCAGPRDERHCPTCGGQPLLSLFSDSGESLVTARRSLECARCSQTWIFPRMTCPHCGESESARLPIYHETEAATFAHLRIEACERCSHYLLNVDTGKDGRAVPVVDEIAAIPLGLYAKGLGLRKAVPNLMEF